MFLCYFKIPPHPFRIKGNISPVHLFTLSPHFTFRDDQCVALFLLPSTKMDQSRRERKLSSAPILRVQIAPTSSASVTTKSFDRFRPAKKEPRGWSGIALHWAAKNPLRPHLLSSPRSLSSVHSFGAVSNPL